MAASTITRGTFVDGTTPWNSSNISSLIYDRIDQMFGGVGGYATLELGGALKINGALTQLSNDGGALGTASLGWSDLFLASGAVINFNNGDVTLTHSADELAFAGASNGYTFANGPVRPATNDGAALGTTATQWSDLFLASGGVINWNVGDVTITHSTNTLTFGGAASGYIFNDGNVGLGVTPSAWDNTRRVLQVGGSGSVWTNTSGSGFLFVMNNAYYDGTNYKYLNTDEASYYAQTTAGDHSFVTAASGTAGNNVTFTERFRVLNGGNIAIGATARLYLDGVAGTGDTYIHEVVANNIRVVAGGNNVASFGVAGGAGAEFFGSLAIGSTQKFYLDGGSDTYLEEYSANEVRLTIGGSAHSAFNATGQYVYYNPPTTASAANAYIAQSDYIRRSTSSRRYKHDVATLDGSDALAAVMAMRPVTYRGKTDADQRRYVGFIAEEVQQWAPLLCTYDDGGESGTPNYVTYDRVTAYLVAVVQQQQQKIAALEARIH